MASTLQDLGGDFTNGPYFSLSLVATVQLTNFRDKGVVQQVVSEFFFVLLAVASVAETVARAILIVPALAVCLIPVVGSGIKAHLLQYTIVGAAVCATNVVVSLLALYYNVVETGELCYDDIPSAELMNELLKDFMYTLGSFSRKLPSCLACC